MVKKWTYSLALIVGGITVLLSDNHTAVPWMWGFELGSVAVAIRLGMLLLAAPEYFFSVGIGGGVVWYVALIFVKEDSVNSALPYAFIVYQITGYVWIFAKGYLTIDEARREKQSIRDHVQGPPKERNGFAEYEKRHRIISPNNLDSEGVPSSSKDGHSYFNGNCPQCRDSYAVLQIPGDASKEVIEMAHKDLRVIYHPDRFQNNERLRQKSEEHFKEIEQAYTHIMKHFVQSAGSFRDGERI
jgi:DnaJ domain